MNKVNWPELPAERREQLLKLFSEMAYQAWQANRNTEVPDHESEQSILIPDTSRQNTSTSP